MIPALPGDTGAPCVPCRGSAGSTGTAAAAHLPLQAAHRQGHRGRARAATSSSPVVMLDLPVFNHSLWTSSSREAPWKPSPCCNQGPAPRSQYPFGAASPTHGSDPGSTALPLLCSSPALPAAYCIPSHCSIPALSPSPLSSDPSLCASALLQPLGPAWEHAVFFQASRGISALRGWGSTEIRSTKALIPEVGMRPGMGIWALVMHVCHLMCCSPCAPAMPALVVPSACVPSLQCRAGREPLGPPLLPPHCLPWPVKREGANQHMNRPALCARHRHYLTSTWLL